MATGWCCWLCVGLVVLFFTFTLSYLRPIKKAAKLAAKAVLSEP